MHGYKFRIYPTYEQKNEIDKNISLYRYVYNWTIAQERIFYEEYKKGLRKYQFEGFYTMVTLFKDVRKNTPWLQEISVGNARCAIRDAISAYERFFGHTNNKPKFKSKKKSKKSFGTRNDRLYFKGNKIKVEGISTYISLGFNTGINEVRATSRKYYKPFISVDNLGNYWISFSMEEEVKNLDTAKTRPLGIDLGVRNTLTLSTGEVFNQPKERINKLNNLLKRVQRHITRDINRKLDISKRTKTKYEDIPKSKRELKRLHRLNKIHTKIHNVKDTFYRTTIKSIVLRNPECIVMEDFRVKEILNNKKCMGKILNDTSFYTILKYAENYCRSYNVPFIKAVRNYPSTQMCSNCGNIKKMYSYKTYKCPVCGFIEDRDINAAINLENYPNSLIYNFI
jgi:putative transposase